MSSYNEVNENGERVYSELNTGDWWRDAERAKPEVSGVFSYFFHYVFFLHAQQGTTLLPILMYLDGTKLSNNGNHSAKPLSMTIGNFPVHQMNKTSAKKVCD